MLGSEDGIDEHLWIQEIYFGSTENEECKIDSIAQTWATISGAGDNDKKYIAIESLENYLVNKEVRNNKIIRSTI